MLCLCFVVCMASRGWEKLHSRDSSHGTKNPTCPFACRPTPANVGSESGETGEMWARRLPRGLGLRSSSRRLLSAVASRDRFERRPDATERSSLSKYSETLLLQGVTS